MSLANRLERCYSGAVYDVMRELGRPDCVLPPAIRPLDPMRKLAGRVWTVEGHLEPDVDPHQSLLAWTAMLSGAPPDSVVVCQPNDLTLSHMGELSAETLQFRKIRGYVADGGCRDSDFILHIGFRVFCRYFTPTDVTGRWLADRFGEPVTIGTATIATGDYVMADRDGIVAVPSELAQEVTRRAEEVLRTENLVRKAILEGVDPQEAYLRYGKF